jgi:hypothetical protein
MCTIVNISDGVLHLDAIGVHIQRGARVVLDYSLADACANSPELTLLLERRLAMVEQIDYPVNDEKSEPADEEVQ